MKKGNQGSRPSEFGENRSLHEDSAEDGRPPPLRVVGIGASAGALKALKQLFAAVPDESGMCFVVVVHLSSEHESHLADLLQAHSRLAFEQVAGTTSLEPNHVYVIPPGANIDAVDTHLRLSDIELQREGRAPINHFFRTLADAHQDQAVGVVLTGTGSDGTLDLQRIREQGGLAIVQSPDEAEYDGMPRSAITAGAADLVLPVEQIPAHLLQLNTIRTNIATSQVAPSSAGNTEHALAKILARVRAQKGHDFTHYKRSTILRRIRRRMLLHQTATLNDYLQLLQDQPQEANLLFEDMLITVSEFFRDHEVFEHLEKHVIPQLFEGKGPADRVRVWSAGCATGEEAYSLAMLLWEQEARRAVKPHQVQIFASDLHEPALQRARQGLYPDAIEANVSPQRLQRFFTRENGHYRVRRELRERVVFALHNLLQDPPFAHLKMICCRNLLIYLKRDVQQHLASLLHYALEDNGYLLVGTAETVDTSLFICENKRFGLYRRRSVPKRNLLLSVFPFNQPHPDSQEQPVCRSEAALSQGALHERIVEQYAPPSVLIRDDGEVMHYSARAGRYLQMPGGKPTNNVYRLVREPLQLELRAAVHAAMEQGLAYRSSPITLSIDNEPTRVILRVESIQQPLMPNCLLVIFDELQETDPALAAGESSDATAHALKAEAEQTKRRMQAMIEEHESNQERLQAYNEELESANEELRSTMEELETSKEEMQSMNEELTTVNQENLQKVDELNELSSDLNNLLTATHIATVFLDREMRIVRFTPYMADLFNMRESDRGRLLSDLAHQLHYADLQDDARRVLDDLAPVDREVSSENGRWYMVRLQPYRASDDRIDGLVMTFIDITDRRAAEERIREMKALDEKIIDTVRNPMLILGEYLHIERANEAFYEMFADTRDDIRGKLIYEIDRGRWNTPRLRQLLEQILPDNNVMTDFELEYQGGETDPRSLLLNACRVDHIQLILLAIEDVTERQQARKLLERSRDELEQQVAHRTTQLQDQATRLQQLLSDLASAEQRERRRIAALLHDDLQQLLVAAKMRLDMVRSQVNKKDVEQPLAQVICHLDEAIESSRSLIRQMNPKILDHGSLVEALHWLSQEMSKLHELGVTRLARQRKDL